MNKIKFSKIVKDIPTNILTCEKFTKEALECKKRIEDFGFTNIKLVYGDEDDRLKNKKIHYQARSFVSTCLTMIEHNIKYVFIFEEDAGIVEKRADKFINSIIWALNNINEWDIFYGGCTALNPMYPYWKNLDLAYSPKAQAGAHCMLFSLKAAKKYIDNNSPNFDRPFDMALRRLNLKSFTTFLPSWYQIKNPGEIDEYKLNLIGDHQFWQDFSILAWLIIASIAFLVVIVVIIKLKNILFLQ